MFDSCLLRLEGDGQVRLRKGGVEAQYGIVWQVAIAYEFLLATLEKAKLEATDRPEPRYYSSCINSAWAKLSKYYHIPCSTHLSASKKKVSLYKMPNFTYTVFDQN